jgi:hypothetical protein
VDLRTVGLDAIAERSRKAGKRREVDTVSNRVDNPSKCNQALEPIVLELHEARMEDSKEFSARRWSSRDAVGSEQLMPAKTGGLFAFASTSKAVLQASRRRREAQRGQARSAGRHCQGTKQRIFGQSMPGITMVSSSCILEIVEIKVAMAP